MGRPEPGRKVDVAQGRCQELRGALVLHHKGPHAGVQLRLPQEKTRAVEHLHLPYMGVRFIFS